jgi:hypothetical protein
MPKLVEMVYAESLLNHRKAYSSGLHEKHAEAFQASADAHRAHAGGAFTKTVAGQNKVAGLHNVAAHLHKALGNTAMARHHKEHFLSMTS